MIHIWSSLPAADPELTRRISALMVQPFDALQRLPEWSTEAPGPDGLEFTINRKHLPNGHLEIVVQAYRPGRRILFLQFGGMAAQGFWAGEDRSIVPMPEDALYPYT